MTTFQGWVTFIQSIVPDAFDIAWSGGWSFHTYAEPDALRRSLADAGFTGVDVWMSECFMGCWTVWCVAPQERVS